MLVFAPQLHIDPPHHSPTPPRAPPHLHPTSVVAYLGWEAWPSCTIKSLDGVQVGVNLRPAFRRRRECETG
jgi:hypothetical protein